jgi:hypothetical protein
LKSKLAQLKLLQTEYAPVYDKANAVATDL